MLLGHGLFVARKSLLLLLGGGLEVLGQVAQDHLVERLVADEILSEDRAPLLRARLPEDGGDLIVRLYECHNSRGSAELSCLREPKLAALCDLEENPIGDLEISDGLIRFDYLPFEIITIRIKV